MAFQYHNYDNFVIDFKYKNTFLCFLTSSLCFFFRFSEAKLVELVEDMLMLATNPVIIELTKGKN